MSRIVTLLKGDIKNMKRDIVLGATIAAPIIMAFFLRFIVPFAVQILREKLAFDLTPFYPLLIGVFLMLVPLLTGCMTGFVLLEDKDEKMLMYYAITPLGREGYLKYRIISPMLVSTILSFFLVYFSNMISISFIKLVPIIFMASLEAVMIALFLGAFGENRVDGLAMTKALGVLIVVPVVDKLVDFKFNWILGIFPTYWVPKAVEVSNTASNFLLVVILGFLVHIIYAFLLYKKFGTKV